MRDRERVFSERRRHAASAENNRKMSWDNTTHPNSHSLCIVPSLRQGRWERKDKNKHTARTNVQRLNILSGTGSEWHSFFACCKPFFDFYIFCSALHFITSHSLCCLVSYFIHDSRFHHPNARVLCIYGQTEQKLYSHHPTTSQPYRAHSTVERMKWWRTPCRCQCEIELIHKSWTMAWRLLWMWMYLFCHFFLPSFLPSSARSRTPEHSGMIGRMNEKWNISSLFLSENK